MARQPKHRAGKRMDPTVFVTWITVAVAVLVGGLAFIGSSERRAVLFGCVLILAAGVLGVVLVWSREGPWRIPAIVVIAVSVSLIGAWAIKSVTIPVTAEINNSFGSRTEFLVASGGTLTPSEENGIYVLFPNIRINNPKSVSVTLLAKLVIVWESGAIMEYEPWLRSFPPEFWAMDLIYPPFQVAAPLVLPLKLGPNDSIQGSLGFLIPGHDLESIGDFDGTQTQMLKLEDLISGQIVVVDETGPTPQ